MKMGEGSFESIQLIDKFVSAHTFCWGKNGVNSYPKGSWSQRDFEAFGHKEIALDKTFTVAPPLIGRHCLSPLTFGDKDSERPHYDRACPHTMTEHIQSKHRKRRGN